MVTTLMVAPSVLASTPATATSHAWSFGVMGDTQWTTTDPSGANPNAVPVSIINQINAQFIAKGVKFVVQVGDLTENGNNADETVRAQAAQSLYHAGIGFYPMRGNHETYASPSNGYAIPIFRTLYPQTQGLSQTFGATDFGSPTLAGANPDDLKGMSYAFDYGTQGDNARFVILDDWATSNKLVNAAGYSYGYSIGEQQSWISSELDQATRGTTHAFVFSHQPIMAENHQDSPFQGYTNANPQMQNDFFASLQNNNVAYYISGHDHINQRSIVASPDGASSVQELIAASDSSKFYTPKALTNANWFGQKSRETSIQQDLYRVGYYIFTVDGPKVTVDYYADSHGSWASDNCYPDGLAPASCSVAGSHVTPAFDFVKRATWGYSTNGKQFLVGGANSTTYTSVQDSFGDTSAAILSGLDANTAVDATGRVLTETVDTGWTAASSKGNAKTVASDILTLWGMAPLGAEMNAIGAGKTDTYTLSMSYRQGDTRGLGTGSFGITARDGSGNWINAVDLNIGGAKQFVMGPWDPSYGLGTYGVDPATKTVWAVIDFNADFAAASGI